MVDRTILDAIAAIKMARAQGDIMILEKIMLDHGVEPKSNEGEFTGPATSETTR